MFCFINMDYRLIPTTFPHSIRISEGFLCSCENGGRQHDNGAGIYSDFLWFPLLITILPLR
jgi:hypothetical protein